VPDATTPPVCEYHRSAGGPECTWPPVFRAVEVQGQPDLCALHALTYARSVPGDTALQVLDGAPSLDVVRQRLFQQLDQIDPALWRPPDPKQQ
jgi:hypothetical protein